MENQGGQGPRGFGDTTVVLLTRDAEQGTGEAAPLPEVSYSFEAQNDPDPRWKVLRVHATEGLSTLYECVVDLAHEALTANPDALLGEQAALTIARASAKRRFFGVVRRVEHRGTVADHRLARVFVVPALWALSQRTDARVFQDMTAVEVVQAVLHEAGLYAGMIEVLVQRECLRREYCVQHGETDLDFVARLLASEGVTFFFRHETEREMLVLADGAHAWEAVRTMDGGPVPVASTEAQTAHVEAVRRLAWEREARPTGVVVRDFDFTRPAFRVEGAAPRRHEGARGRYEPGTDVTLGQYRAGAYSLDDAQEQAQLRLEAERAEEAVGSGEGTVTGMIPGGMFQLVVAGGHVPTQRYVVVRVEHEGSAREELLRATAGESPDEDRYRNRFRCVPVEVPYRPPRSTARPVVAGLQSATVVGPAGEEVYTDEHGRVRVQFHWDRVGTRDEHSACWLRVVQGPWAGGGWGLQFLPRVGMEVVVSFLGGDPDRPVVLGALYNGENRTPFPLPDARTRSGVRTQSTGGGGGHNELSFEDAAGAEQVFLRAERDHDEVVGRDHTQRVGHDQRVEVGGRRVDRVAGDETRSVHANRVTWVASDATDTVGGRREETVHGSLSLRVARDQTTRVEGDRHDAVLGDEESRVGGHARREVGGLTETVHGERVERVTGSSVLIVGTHELSRSLVVHVEGHTALTGRGPTELTSDEGLVLRCGDSAITLTPERIELRGKAIVLAGEEATVTLADKKVKTAASGDVLTKGDNIKLKSSGASILLDSDAKVDGSTVKLKFPTSLGDDDEDSTEPTTIELVDKDGNPMPGRRYTIALEDGTERSGVLDAQGKATLVLDQNAKVRFPDLVDVEKQ